MKWKTDKFRMLLVMLMMHMAFMAFSQVHFEKSHLLIGNGSSVVDSMVNINKNGNNIYINSTPESPLRMNGEKLFIGNLFNVQSECPIELDNTDINLTVSEVVIYPSAHFSEESSTIITVK